MGGDWVNITTEIQKALKKSTSKRGKTNADFLKKMIYNNVCLEGFLVLRNFGLYPTIHDDLEPTAPWLYRITKLFMEGSQNPQATRQKEISSAIKELLDSTDSKTFSTHTTRNLNAQRLLSSVTTPSAIHYVHLDYIRQINNGALDDLINQPIFPDKGVYKPSTTDNIEYPFDNIIINKMDGVQGITKIESLSEFTMENREDHPSPTTLLTFAACCLKPHLDNTYELEEALDYKENYSGNLEELQTEPMTDTKKSSKKSRSGKKSRSSKESSKKSDKKSEEKEDGERYVFDIPQ